MLLCLYVVLTIIIASLYVGLLLYILAQWEAAPSFDLRNSNSLLHLSIVIPARNEENSIGSCIESLKASIEKAIHTVEVIIINDHSEDNTVAIVESYDLEYLTLLHLSDYLKSKKINAYKKVALEYGLSEAKGEYIIQLDADVVVGEQYLETITAIIQSEQPDFVACPVIFNPDDSALGHFQCLDMLGMMAVTCAGIQSNNWHMANGANMIYRKGVVSFSEETLASGDDVYSIQKISKDPANKILFAKSTAASVITEVEKSFADFFSQRLRWATKNKYMKSWKMQAMMLIPFLNVIWLLLHIAAALLIGPHAVALGCFHLLVKLGTDYVYLSKLSSYYGRAESMSYFFVSNALHIVYILSVGVASLLVNKYTWKGRKVR